MIQTFKDFNEKIIWDFNEKNLEGNGMWWQVLWFPIFHFDDEKSETPSRAVIAVRKECVSLDSRREASPFPATAELSAGRKRDPMESRDVWGVLGTGMGSCWWLWRDEQQLKSETVRETTLVEAPFFPLKMAPFWLQLCCVLLFTVARIDAEELAPPYFNLADNRRIYASATCGEDVTGPELYCKLVGASSSSTSGTSPEHEIIGQVIQGQVSMRFALKFEKCC